MPFCQPCDGLAFVKGAPRLRPIVVSSFFPNENNPKKLVLWKGFCNVERLGNMYMDLYK